MREKLVYPFINTVAHVVISLTIVSVNQLIMFQEPKSSSSLSYFLFV